MDEKLFDAVLTARNFASYDPDISWLPDDSDADLIYALVSAIKTIRDRIPRGPDKASWVAGYRISMASHHPPALKVKDVEAIFDAWYVSPLRSE